MDIQEDQEEFEEEGILIDFDIWILFLIKKVPHPGIEPGPPGWKPGILTI